MAEKLCDRHELSQALMQSPPGFMLLLGYRISELVPGFLVLSSTGVSSGERTCPEPTPSSWTTPQAAVSSGFGGWWPRFTVAEMTHWVFALTLKLEAAVKRCIASSKGF